VSTAKCCRTVAQCRMVQMNAGRAPAPIVLFGNTQSVAMPCVTQHDGHTEGPLTQFQQNTRYKLLLAIYHRQKHSLVPATVEPSVHKSDMESFGNASNRITGCDPACSCRFTVGFEMPVDMRVMLSQQYETVSESRY
jgi:hypothetical protein